MIIVCIAEFRIGGGLTHKKGVGIYRVIVVVIIAAVTFRGCAGKDVVAHIVVAAGNLAFGMRWIAHKDVVANQTVGDIVKRTPCMIVAPVTPIGLMVQDVVFDQAVAIDIINSASYNIVADGQIIGVGTANFAPDDILFDIHPIRCMSSVEIAFEIDAIDVATPNDHIADPFVVIEIDIAGALYSFKHRSVCSRIKADVRLYQCPSGGQG